MYLKRKPYSPFFEIRCKTGRILVMKGSKSVLVKVVLFQLRGHGHPQDDAMPNSFADSKRPICSETVGLYHFQGFKILTSIQFEYDFCRPPF